MESSMKQTKENKQINDIRQGLETAFVNYRTESNLAYRPQFVSNDYKAGRKVLASLEQELKSCDEFLISVAFITQSGIAPLLQILKELEEKKIPGKILTTNYLTFSDPKALEKLNSYTNIELRMSYVQNGEAGFHTKGYIFREQEVYKIILGSSNMTLNALTINKEWNAKLVSTEQGEVAKEILDEFHQLWQEAQPLEEWLDVYKEIYEAQKEVRKQSKVTTIQQYTLQPNTMQVSFIQNLKKLREADETRAILISATGTGKTYASAFALRDINPKKALFLVHREQIAKQAIVSYRNVFGDTKKMGLLSGNSKDFEAEFLFSTMQMMAKPEIRNQFSPEEFEVIVIDEVHRVGANSYGAIIDYFKPQFLLGMTASPERPDGFDIYALFDHNIAYEIRLQHALEENLLCPFHYFGITDLEIDGETFDDETGLRNFNLLTSDQRVKYILDQIEYYGFSGETVCGLVFCSSKEEARELSKKFNELGYRTAALTGEDSQEKREQVISHLVEESHSEKLDYIFTVDIFNEGVDIPEINQVIMLRPTQSPIVFIQQLGRGLRKAQNKEYVTIIDFIGNYRNNFMIPIALSGDRSYNKDTIRRYLIEGSRILPGSSSIHFDEVSRKRIFTSIDQAKPNTIQFLKQEYMGLKNKLGRIPRYLDFEEHGAIDVLLFFENNSLGSYHEFLKRYEKEYEIQFTKIQEEMLMFISNKIANGKRLEELSLLKRMVAYQAGITGKTELKDWYATYKTSNAVKVLTNDFVTSEVNKKKYENSIFVEESEGTLHIADQFLLELEDETFHKEVKELVEFGLYRNQLYYKNTYRDTDFVLYQKYTYEDVCKLLNWSSNVVAQNIGGYKYDEETNTFPVFINYVKDDTISASIKYEDRFLNSSTLIALSKQPRTIESKDVKQIYNAKKNGTRIYLFVRKNKDDNVSKEFYFLGEIEAIGDPFPVVMKETNKNAVEITYRLDVPVREDIYEYIIS